MKSKNPKPTENTSEKFLKYLYALRIIIPFILFGVLMFLLIQEAYPNIGGLIMGTFVLVGLFILSLFVTSQMLEDGVSKFKARQYGNSGEIDKVEDWYNEKKSK